MKKTYPFAILYIILWIISTLYIGMQILSIARYSGGAGFLQFILIFSVISILLITAVVGIGFRQAWARKLYVYVSIIAFVVIFCYIMLPLIKTDIFHIYPFIMSMLSVSPWLGLLCYGMYYINRKDVLEALGLAKEKKQRMSE